VCVLSLDNLVHRTEIMKCVACDGSLISKGKGKGKGKAVPLQAWIGPEGSGS